MIIEPEGCADSQPHDPHFFVPEWVEPDECSADFEVLCGGKPRKVICFEDAQYRLRHIA